MSNRKNNKKFKARGRKKSYREEYRNKRNEDIVKRIKIIEKNKLINRKIIGLSIILIVIVSATYFVFFIPKNNNDSFSKYNISLVYGGMTFSGSSKANFITKSELSTRYGEYYDITGVRYGKATLQGVDENKIVLEKWDKYEDEIGNLILSESKWNFKLTGFEKESIVQRSEFGLYEKEKLDSNRYQLTYIEKFFINGEYLSTIQGFKHINIGNDEYNVTTPAGTFSSNIIQIENYENGTYIGKTVIWESEGVFIKQHEYNTNDILVLSFILSEKY